MVIKKIRGTVATPKDGRAACQMARTKRPLITAPDSSATALVTIGTRQEGPSGAPLLSRYLQESENEGKYRLKAERRINGDVLQPAADAVHNICTARPSDKCGDGWRGTACAQVEGKTAI